MDRLFRGLGMTRGKVCVVPIAASIRKSKTAKSSMINLLIGPPGGGKSYEATVFHVLKALNAGRKVITNLPLELGRLETLGFDCSLIELRNKTLGNPPGREADIAGKFFPKPTFLSSTPAFLDRPFANPEDYGDTWRHPETGSGPLYVIDECHMCLPRGATRRDVEEWYSLHRHESADVLLITQSYGKVSKPIIDLVQVCYRVKKATAFGSATKYIRKVQDGVRGDVVNTSIRQYEKKYFGLYKSHTRGGGQELEAQDIIPIWRRWPFIGLALCVVVFCAILFGTDVSLNPMNNGMAKTPTAAQAKPVRVVEEVNGVVVSDTATPVAPPTQTVKHTETQSDADPYAGKNFHVIGAIEGARSRHLFAVSQNGQVVSHVETSDLEKLGYIVTAPTACAVRIDWQGSARWVICDAPTASVVPAASRSQG